MKQRILSGVQSSGTPHIGNYLGAMRQHIQMQETHESYIFIADLHALTTVKDPKKLKQATVDLALDYLALGLDPAKTTFFRQSDVPQHTELAWTLACQAPMGLLERAHAWKDAVAKGTKNPTVGLFTYPILMAADILLYQPDLVPVGKDQKQHVEITRDLAEKFNAAYGDTFKVPQPHIPEETSLVTGTDGEKMSKSYGNVIEIFAEEPLLKKQVMGIVTDATPLEDPKDPAACNVFKLYAYFATPQEKQELAEKYTKGGFGYGDAKKLLLQKLLETFASARQKRVELTANVGYVEEVLQKGAEKARKAAGATMKKVRGNIGLQVN